MNTTAWLEELALFLGAASVATARCYARCPRPAEGRDWRLAGTVRGPFSTRARTLPATTAWSDTGPGPTLMATALIPDPCYWTPENPALYDIQLRLLDGSQEIASVRRTLGLRRLGPDDRAFRFESKRWVLRGITSETLARLTPVTVARSAETAPPPICRAAPAAGSPATGSSVTGSSANDARLSETRDVWESAPWRDQCAALVANGLTDAEGDRAQRVGRLLVAWLRADRAGWRDELLRLSRSAAVAFAVLEGDMAAVGDAATIGNAATIDDVASPRKLAPNLCLLQAFSARDRVLPSEWAHGVVVQTEDDPFEFARRTADCPLPVVAYRPFVPRPDQPVAWSRGGAAAGESPGTHASEITGVSDAFMAARAAVDALQRDLAPAGDYAGYLV